MEKELVAKNRKLKFYRTKRNGKEIVNAVRMTFSNEPVGTVFYIETKEDGFILHKNPINNAEQREVKSMKSKRGIYNAQQYLNFLGIAKEPKDYDIFKDETGSYHMKESSIQPSEKKVTYFKKKNTLIVNGCNTVRLPKNWLNKVIAGKFSNDYVFLNEIHLSPYCFVKIKLVKASECENIQTIQDINGNNLSCRLEKDTIFTKNKVGCTFTINRFLRNEAHISSGSYVTYREEDDGSLILEFPEQYCDICGKEVNRTSEAYYDMDVCSSCEETIKILKKHAVSNGNDLSKVKNNLEVAYSQLKEIYDMIMEESK